MTDGIPALAGWRWLGASAQGTAHRRLGLACQDAHGGLELAGTVFAGAVADGLGSADLGERGAAVAVEAALAAWEAALAGGRPEALEEWREAARGVFAAARDAVLREAADARHDPRRYATTLAFAVCGPDFAAAGQVGDGFVVVDWGADGLATLAPPARGEYANEVLPLTDERAVDAAQFDWQPRPARAACLSTDGLLRLALKLPECAPAPGFFGPLWEFARNAASALEGAAGLQAFLDSPAVCARTDDDKTLVLAARLDGA